MIGIENVGTSYVLRKELESYDVPIVKRDYMLLSNAFLELESRIAMTDFNLRYNLYLEKVKLLRKAEILRKIVHRIHDILRILVFLDLRAEISRIMTSEKLKREKWSDRHLKNAELHSIVVAKRLCIYINNNYRG